MQDEKTLVIQENRLKEKIKRELGETILSALLDPSVIEIQLNPDHRVWVIKLGCDPEFLCEMPPSKSNALIGSVAHALGTIANADHPIVEGEFFLDGSRFEGLLPPVVSAPAFVVRKKATKIFTFADYVKSGIMSAFQKQYLENAVKAKKNILVVGGTGSGKTTLVNAFINAIAELCPDDRLAIIEDTAEIQCRQENAIVMRSTATTPSSRLLKATLRLTPDRILFGEVRGGEALELLKSWNTGHPGGLCTIHANDAYGGLLRLEQCISEITSADMRKFISETVDVVVFIKKQKDGSRLLSEVMEIGGLKDGDYVTKLITESAAKPHVVNN